MGSNLSNLTVKIIEQPDPEMIARVAALEEEAFGRGGLNEWHLPVIARHGRLVVIIEDERVVGAASLLRDWVGRSAFLFDLVIAGDVRGRGRGRLLLEGVIENLRNDGVERLELTVAPDNKAAVDLYAQVGFTRTGVLADEYGRGQDRLTMALTL